VPETVLILTPVKDAKRHLDGYFERLAHLTYPAGELALGMLESDSRDNTCAGIEARLPALRATFRSAQAWKKDFGYRVPRGLDRSAPEIQLMRRAILARSRNQLLFRALTDEAWVLWLDVDVIEFPDDIIERLIAVGKNIVHPHCVLDYGGPSYDRNAWARQGSLHLDGLRTAGDLVELDTVGGTMLLVRADVHRDGLIFPPFPYGVGHELARPGRGEIETEGLGLMARDMGHRCWGLPNLEIRHARE
jgi:Anp1